MSKETEHTVAMVGAGIVGVALLAGITYLVFHSLTSPVQPT